MKKLYVFFVLLQIPSIFLSFAYSAKIISSHGYDNCIELSNAVCRVVLEPNLGGRVLVYEIEARNVLYIDLAQNGLEYDNEDLEKAPNMQPCAGRFDIGPEKLNPENKIFWQGKWTAQITGKYSARMTSQVESKTGIQLVRDFKLNPKSSELLITQTIKNFSNKSQKLCFWSRTFATGGGICIVPISNPNRFPSGYLSYGEGNVMNYKPKDERNIKVSANYFLMTGPSEASKFVFDTDKGWMGYITKDNLLFIKKYDYKSTYEYGEMSAVPLSIWYKDETVAELEPIGPWEWIKPNKQRSFTEKWYLYPYKYPKNQNVDIKQIESIVVKNSINH